jgi:hypothetical protein
VLYVHICRCDSMYDSVYNVWMEKLSNVDDTNDYPADVVEREEDELDLLGLHVCAYM